MAKAGRPYFKRYETKITDHKCAYTEIFCSRLQCYKLIKTLLTLPLRSIHLSYLSLEVIVELHENIFHELALFLLPNNESLFDILLLWSH